MTPADATAGALTLGLLAVGSWIVWVKCWHEWTRHDEDEPLPFTVWTCGRCGRRRIWSEFF